MRIATWNVERVKPKGWKIAPAQLYRMAEVDADVWLLTETHLDHRPTSMHGHFVFSPPHPERRPLDERWAAIWSRWPLTPIEDPAPHQRGTVAAIVQMPGAHFIAYCTVIAWANEPFFDDGRPARMWEIHHAEAERQAAEWVRIRELHPDLPLVVGGDFNHDRDGSGWYGSDKGRRIVTTGLTAAGLDCVTDFDVVALGLLPAQHLVDHICVPSAWADRTDVTVLDRFDTDGTRLSDHPTVIVDVAIDASTLSVPYEPPRA